MDELYTSFHYSSSPILEDGSSSYYMTTVTAAAAEYDYDDDQGLSNNIIKAQIANHPLYPTLLSSYIECTKVGASPEMASLLEEISKENQPTFLTTQNIGTDPELDYFMKSYCDALNKYKEELSKPFEEARKFLSSVGSELNHLCKETLQLQPTSTSTSLHHSTADWEEDKRGELIVMEESGDKELREMLMRKYSGYLTTLRMDLLKKRKKGKLPKNAISALLDWWNSHYRWPYPTEEEKSMLSEKTGLDQKQINNWFINQRKRHWRPSEDMKFALMEGVGAVAADAVCFDAAAGGGGDHVNISTNY